ncbi:CidA/LrgA family protein [Methylobacterium planeticum]|uniref:CidA/LrgA family protein n=1 Tax=Methylobacterium planeticum TaxID=2615211 RepID=A0A6N6MTZ7_9HYPH|nr:CidA/LrgA family protein [Methylobacterium planeticum]KAB1072187.1 CidA/LrgA family protein [Methylobacterium planeticum]
MLEALARVFVWLSAGEILMRVGGLPVPAPVIGLVLLYVDLLYRRRLPDDLGTLADRVLSMLGMLFVPAGVGVVAYSDVLHAEFVPIAAAILGGTFATMLATALAADLILMQERRRELSRAEPERPEAADVTA